MTLLPHRDRYEFFGGLAFVLVVLAVFSEFLGPREIDGAVWQLVTVFVAAAVYASLGLIGTRVFGPHPRGLAFYVAVQTALATFIVVANPLKGFSGLITMPAASLAVLELGWLGAGLVVVELFAVVLGALWWEFGRDAALGSMPSYGIAFVFVVVFSLVTRHARAAKRRAEQLSAEVATANEQLRRYASEAGDLATTRERNRLAREIHDGLGHYLTTINVQLEAARAVFDHQPAQAASALEKAAQLTRDALDDVRRSVGTLRADVARPPLPDALRALAHNLGLAIDLQLRGTPRPLPPAIEHALFRAAQEGLTNVRKHAAATETAVTLDFLSPARVALTIADNGRGLPAHAPAPTGHGLRGVRERIELLGGTVTTRNGAERGFTLQIELPA
jgi:signal transduction histidine kinase